MYKIEKISVNNFKNIVNTDLELGDMNVIVGPNNSGKSNFLQVIPFLRFVINGDLENVKEEFDFKGSTSIWRHLPSWSFDNSIVLAPFINIQIQYKEIESNVSYNYELELHFSFREYKNYLSDTTLKNETEQELNDKYAYVVETIPIVEISRESLFFKQNNKTGKAVRIFERDENGIKTGENIKGFKDSFSFLPYASFLRYLSLLVPEVKENSFISSSINGINEIIKSPIFYFSVSELKKKANENPVSNLNERIIWSDIPKKINEIFNVNNQSENFRTVLKKILDIDNVSFFFHSDKRKENLEILFEHNNHKKFINEFSDGTILLITLIAEIFSNKNDIIFIEEPENSIHPRALQELIKFMREFEDKKQFIITTHSSTLLNIIKDPGNIIIAEVNEKGESTLRKPKDIKALRKKLSKGFLSLGDLLYFNIDQEPTEKENDTTIY